MLSFLITYSNKFPSFINSKTSQGSSEDATEYKNNNKFKILFFYLSKKIYDSSQLIYHPEPFRVTSQYFRGQAQLISIVLRMLHLFLFARFLLASVPSEKLSLRLGSNFFQLWWLYKYKEILNFKNQTS